MSSPAPPGKSQLLFLSFFCPASQCCLASACAPLLRSQLGSSGFSSLGPTHFAKRYGMRIFFFHSPSTLMPSGIREIKAKTRT